MGGALCSEFKDLAVDIETIRVALTLGSAFRLRGICGPAQLSLVVFAITGPTSNARNLHFLPVAEAGKLTRVPDRGNLTESLEQTSRSAPNE